MPYEEDKGVINVGEVGPTMLISGNIYMIKYTPEFECDRIHLHHGRCTTLTRHRMREQREGFRKNISQLHK